MSDTEYLPRHIDSALAAAVRSSPIVVLDGPRGVGKTTTAQRMARSTLMFPRDLAQVQVNPDAYLASLPTPVLIDEWQLAGVELLWALKRVVDNDPTPGRFILTGSVEPATYGPTYPLTGRVVQLMMRPMTLAELRGAGDAPLLLAELQNGRSLRASAGAESSFDLGWLTRPGFPAARALPDPGLYLDSYAAVVSQRAGDEGRDSSRFLRTMRALATLSAQAVPDQRIWESADISKITWGHYDDLLIRTHLSVPAPAWSSNRLARLTTYPKRFIADTAMAISLASLTEHDLRADRHLAGRYLESYVAQQLRPQVDRIKGSLLHLRTGSGEHEVDAIVQTPRGILGIEVKLGSRPTAADVRQLDWLREKLGDRFTHGLIIHTGGDTYPLGERIWAVPIDAFSGSWLPGV